MKKVKIGGVPEHFNMPWHYALEKGYFKKAGINLMWTEYPSGSAPLAIDMHSGKLDLAVMLTESIITSIVMGNNNSRVASFYVNSPLVWGIHTSKNGPIKTTDDMPGKKYAISRYGSGSHLMALVDARNRELVIDENNQFVVANNLSGAAKALIDGSADLFLWEKFTTKPLVTNGTFRCIGECPTPWPCFVIAGNLDFLWKNKETVSIIASIVEDAAAEFRELPDAAEIIARHYNQELEDAHAWLASVSWSKNAHVSIGEINNVTSHLYSLGIIRHMPEGQDLLFKL